MTWLAEYSLFFLKVFTVVVAVIVLLLFIAGQKKRKSRSATLDIIDLTKEYRHLMLQLKSELLSKEQFKKWHKIEKKQHKQQDKLQGASKQPTLYVLSFTGGIQATEVENLRKEITALLAIVSEQDEVLLRLESAGGVVHGYGLAAAQLKRITEKSLNLTVSVDKVAASGGYMMACVAQQIIAAPFAIIGSIGVVAQVPNINRLLKKNDVDIELHTAGQYKRTLTLLGENTEQGRRKFQDELNTTHQLFKDFIHDNRPKVDLMEVATGEYWFATQALDKKLVDKIGTSDEFLLEKINTHRIVALCYAKQKTVLERMIAQFTLQVEKRLAIWISHFNNPHI